MYKTKFQHILLVMLSALVLVSSLGFTLLSNESDGGEDTPEEQPYFNWGIRPEDPTQGYFTFILEPGQSVNDAIMVLNNADEGFEPQGIDVSVFEGKTGLTGGITFSYDKGDTSSWVTMPGEGEHMVEAGKAVRLPFTVTVPEGTPPGEYVAGIVAMKTKNETEEIEAEGENAGSGGFQIEVVPRVGITVLVIVPEPTLCRVEVDSMSIEVQKERGRLNGIINMRHTGDLHYSGVGTLELIPVDDKTTAPPPTTFRVGYFIPGDEMHYPLYFYDIPEAGEYNFKLSFDGDCEFVFADDLQYVIDLDKKDIKEAEEAAQEQAQGNNGEQGNSSTNSTTTWLLSAVICLLVAIIFGLVMFAVVYFAKKGKNSHSDN